MKHPYQELALLFALAAISGCASRQPPQEPLPRQPIVRPAECLSPSLPSTQVLTERWDSLLLADQAAMLANAVAVNEHRRHVAEAILARCAMAWAKVE